MRIKIMPLLVSLLILGLFIVGCGGEQQEQSAEENVAEEQVPQPMSDARIHEVTGEELNTEANDPVCNMDVTVAENTPAAEYRGETYYFCSEYCRDEFLKDPAEYLSSSGQMADSMRHNQ